MKTSTDKTTPSGLAAGRVNINGLCRRAGIVAAGLLALAVLPAGQAAADGLREQAETTLKKAATFFRTQVATQGGYAYYYSEDLQNRWGEGVGTADQVWVEPPGTPAVGRAYLEAYDATGDQYYLDAAKETAAALIHGQLKSGGWTQTIDFNPQGERVEVYRNGMGKKKGRNNSSLDDNRTQASLQFLIRLDKTLGFKDAAVHDAVVYGMDALLSAQFPNGAFPQGWTGPVGRHPVIKASYQKEWPRLWPNPNYWDYYTLNDGLSGTVSDTLLVAIDAYKDDRYREALTRLGDFLILAQMPDPQPAWAQQYNYEMQPMWARKFEPPAISGLESEDAIKTLMKIYRFTGDKKYLDPIPQALAYLKKSRLSDGRMARYYELESNKPLYMNRERSKDGKFTYFTTYSDKNLPSHYGWKQKTEVDELAKEFAALKSGKAGRETAAQTVTPEGKLIAIVQHADAGKATAEMEKQVRKIILDLDRQGRWVTDHDGSKLVGQPKFAKGFRYIGCNVFNHNVEVLSQYLAATAK